MEFWQLDTPRRMVVTCVWSERKIRPKLEFFYQTVYIQLSAASANPIPLWK